MRYAWIAAAFAFGVSSTAAVGQGTPEQREACTPDALRLCSDTIPDIPKTTACMKAHVAALSPRCRAAFAAAAPAAPPTVQPAELRPRAVAKRPARRDVYVRYPAWCHRTPADPDAEVPYVPPRRVIAPPVYSEVGPVIFPRRPLPDGSFCSPPYDFCEPDLYDEW